MKYILLLISAMALMGMGESPAPKLPVPLPIPVPSRMPDVGIPIAKNVHYSPVKGYTSAELEVLKISEDLSNGILQTSCFQDFMLNRGLIWRGGRTPQQVVNHLRTSYITVPLVMYYTDNNIVGYRQPPELTIYTNRKFHAGATACARASNLLHEWSHSAGYDHSFEPTTVRPYTVPYSINAAFTACCSCKGVKDCRLKP